MVRKEISFTLLTSLVILFGLIFFLKSLKGEHQKNKKSYAGTKMCRSCHEEQYQNYKSSVHFLIEQNKKPGYGCETCHGPGSKHVESGGGIDNIFSFKASISSAHKSEKCLQCHSSDNINFTFRTSDHMNGSVACSDCHQAHPSPGKATLSAEDGYKLCLECHPAIEAKLFLNERHRIIEGVVKCVDCHKIHQNSPRNHLGGFNQKICFQCHTEKQGPFIFEHPAIQTEGCVICHEPHGSVNRHMLIYQNTGDLCYSCHTSVPFWHSRFTSQSMCTNCHTAIHGSHLDPFFLK